MDATKPKECQINKRRKKKRQGIQVIFGALTVPPSSVISLRQERN